MPLLGEVIFIFCLITPGPGLKRLGRRNKNRTGLGSAPSSNTIPRDAARAEAALAQSTGAEAASAQLRITGIDGTAISAKYTLCFKVNGLPVDLMAQFEPIGKMKEANAVLMTAFMKQKVSGLTRIESQGALILRGAAVGLAAVAPPPA